MIDLNSSKHLILLKTLILFIFLGTINQPNSGLLIKFSFYAILASMLIVIPINYFGSKKRKLEIKSFNNLINSNKDISEFVFDNFEDNFSEIYSRFNIDEPHKNQDKIINKGIWWNNVYKLDGRPKNKSSNEYSKFLNIQDFLCYFTMNSENINIWKSGLKFEPERPSEYHQNECHNIRIQFLARVNEMEILPFKVTLFHLYYVLYFREKDRLLSLKEKIELEQIEKQKSLDVYKLESPNNEMWVRQNIVPQFVKTII